jgi:hypothetical protein
MVAAGRNMPLPTAKPKIPEEEAVKGKDKNDQARTEDEKAKPDNAKGGDQPKAPRKSRQQAGPARSRPGS